MAESKRYTDFGLEDFRRYHGGGMSYDEQYRFERKLHEDPFFAEAFEGFLLAEKDKVDYRKSMDELRARLYERIAKKRSRIIPFWMYAAVAGIVVSLGAGWLVLLSEKVVPAVEQNSGTFSIPEKKQLAEKKNDTSETPALTRSEKSVGLRTKSRDITKSVLTQDASVARQEEEAKGAELSDELLSAAPQVSPASPKYKIFKPDYAMRKSLEATVVVDFVKGRIVDKEGKGIPGVIVSKSDTEGTVTDSTGNFTIKATKGDSLKLAFVGFHNRNLLIGKSELGDLVLEEDALALNEVVVVGYGVQKKTSVTGAVEREKKTKESPVPAQGWEAYTTYLTEKARSSSRKGNVQVSFTVNADGSLTHFTAKGKKQLRKEAIQIIKEGPAWLPVKFNGIGIAKPVEVSVQFK